MPATVHGTRWVWIRVTAIAVAVVTTAVLAACLGFAQPERSGTAAAIADADYVIEELPIVSVARVDAAGSSSRSSTMADYTVNLPSSQGGRATPATFRAYNGKGVREVGETYEVAYAPQRPGLGAVGDTSADAVEGQLTGHALSSRSIPFVAAGWAIAVVLAVAVGTGIASRPRGERRVGGDWVALRAVVTGQAEHVEEAGGGVGTSANSGKSGKSGSRYACLTLRTDAGEDVPLVISAKLQAATPVLTGTEGRLLWNPRGDGKAKVAADFVADDGWQLPGRVPGAVAARIAAGPRGAFTVDAGRRTRLLELGGFWPRTVPMGLVVGLLVAAAAVGALLVPVNGGWRVWAALVVVLAPLLGQLLAKGATSAPGVAVER
ncbi:hypothetical protein [Streptomyces endophyticus]|uniref:DUF3592 domain-containing protein n=1 Tax=Streptomyces endophyticus TaxID=714166 RepID=A0ABU6FF51_9ACTN|nr:hypothetical protein [Streptomyces endophyticus]MEB8342670.1 hypothetical protein [Streptomyces endophyticus]